MDFITSVDQLLSKGAEFPPPGSVRLNNTTQKPGRLDTYATNKQLFEGDHDTVYDDWSKVLRQDQAKMVELAVNFHRRLSRLWKSLMLTEPPTITANKEAQDWVDGIVKETRLWQQTGSLVIDMSRFGVGLFKVTHKPGLGVRIKAQPPLIGEAGNIAGGWFPIVDPMDRQEVTGHVIAWTGSVREMAWGIAITKKYLHAEIHEAGKVTVQKWTMNGRVINELVEEEVTLVPGVGMLLTPAQNNLTSDSPYGVDDYADIDPLIHAVELRLSQIDKVLDVHSDPNIQGPVHMVGGGIAAGEAAQQAATAAGRGPTPGPQVRLGGKFFGINPDDPKVEYVTWDGNLDAGFKQIEVAMEFVFILSETSPAAFGQLKAGLAESGSALRRLMMAPLLKVADMRNTVDSAVTEALMEANQLARAMGEQVPELTDVEMEWKDGLPQDRNEDALIETAMVMAELRSKSSAIGTVYGLEGEALKDELKAIESDKKAKAAAAPKLPAPQDVLDAARGQEPPAKDESTEPTE